MNITALYCDYNDKLGEQSNSLNQFVTASLLHIIGQYFSKWSSYFVITLCCHNEDSCNFYHNMFNKIFSQWNEWPVQIVMVNRNENVKVPGFRRNNMIFTDSYDAFIESEIHTYTANYNFNEYYFIFLQTPDNLSVGEIKKIFEYCWHHYLINCIIQIQNSKGEILLYTYYPFTAKHCGQIEPILINQFNGTSLIHEELFPKKLTNLHGCPLKAALWHCPPYVFLSTDSNNRTYISGGFEGKLLLQLSEKFNFTLDVKVPENDSQRGLILADGSLTGALGMLSKHDADISMGAFLQNSRRNNVVTFTMNYYQTGISLVELSDTYFLTSTDILLFPFTKGAWSSIFVMVLITMAVTAILNRIYKSQLNRFGNPDSMDVLLMLLGMPAIFLPKQNVNRILSTSWMVYSLIIRTIYQALLFHLLRTYITEEAPRTLEKMADRNYTMIMHHQAAATLQDMTALKSLNVIVINTTSDLVPLEYLEKFPITRKAVAVATTIVLQYYTETFHKPGMFKVMPYILMHFKVCMYLTKHSFLIDHFDNALMWIQDFGLMEVWSNQVFDKSYYTSQNVQTDRAFGFQQLQMAFALMLGCYTVAIMCLIFEVLYKRFQ